LNFSIYNWFLRFVRYPLIEGNSLIHNQVDFFISLFGLFLLVSFHFSTIEAISTFFCYHSINLFTNGSLSSCHFKIKGWRSRTSDCMKQKWIWITEMMSSFTFSEIDSCRHAVHNPRTCLNDSSLGDRKWPFRLINWFSKSFLSFAVKSIICFCLFGKSIKIGEVLAEENAQTFSSEKWLTNPFSDVQFFKLCISKLLFWVIIKSR